MEEGGSTPHFEVWRGDIWPALASHPETRKHVADPGFVAAVKAIQQDPAKELPKHMGDPRVMQAMMLLMGQGLKVSEEDLQEAERQGHMDRRSPVLLEHKEAAMVIPTATEAKEQGNKLFQKGDYPMAIACYERCAALVEDGQGDLTLKQTALSNMAQAYLKLNRFREAEQFCSEALKTEPTGGLKTKLLYRRGLARDGQGLYKLEVAIQDLSDALKNAELTKASGEELNAVKGSLERLCAVRAEREQRRREESEAEQLRKSGSAVPSPPRGTPAEPKIAEVHGGKPSPKKAAAVSKRSAKSASSAKSAERPPPKFAPVSEVDYSFRVRQRLDELLKDQGCPTPSGGRITLKTGLTGETKISASWLAKGGSTGALYYDFVLHMGWKGTSRKGRPKDADSGVMEGMIRLYNVGQDTSYNPGGHPSVSYMYSLGFPASPSRAHAEEPWEAEIKESANDLFDIFAEKIAIVVKEMHGWAAAAARSASSR
eukprot:RCo030108